MEGLFEKGGLYDSSPLRAFLETEFSSVKPTKSLTVGIVDVITGVFTDFNEKTIQPNLVDIMYASFAIAGFFPPVKAMGSEWFDGSAVWDIDIFSAINKCLTIVSDPSAVVVDVIMTSSANLK